MIGYLKRPFLYPVSIIAAVLTYIAVALVLARFVLNILVLQCAALYAVFFSAWGLARFIERKSMRRASVALTFAILLTGFVGIGMWRLVGQPEKLENAPSAQAGEGKRWTLPDGSKKYLSTLRRTKRPESTPGFVLTWRPRHSASQILYRYRV